MSFYFDVLKKYAVFSGRASRKEYWMFVLWNFIVYLVLFLLTYVSRNALTMGIYYLYALGVLVPSLAVLARRLHDTSRSGWWILIGLVPFVGAIVLLVFALTGSKPGDNQYGPSPKGIAQQAA